MTPPDTVYSIWLMTGIKARKVLGSKVHGDGVGLLIKDGFEVYGRPLDDGTWKDDNYNQIYYPTWEAAHEAALAKCHKKIAQAKKEIASSERAIKKLEAMRE